MTISAERRSEINRENARKSTGPRTDEGKARSRANALKHGLRAEAVALPHEDPDAVKARSQAWNQYYRPDSPAAQHLVNQCVQATLLSDRVHRYHDAAVSAQVAEALDAWDRARAGERDALVRRLVREPAEAVAGLRRTAAGCRWLAAGWVRLVERLDTAGHWTGLEREEASQMLGFGPESMSIRDHPDVWMVCLYTLLSRPNPLWQDVQKMLAPGYIPDAFRATHRADAPPDADTCRRWLRETGTAQVARLSAEADDREVDDARARDAAADRAFLAPDAAPARLFLRYHAEARTAFQRAYNSLLKSQNVDAPAPEPVAPPEPLRVAPESRDDAAPGVESTPPAGPFRVAVGEVPERSDFPRPASPPSTVSTLPAAPVSVAGTG